MKVDCYIDYGHKVIHMVLQVADEVKLDDFIKLFIGKWLDHCSFKERVKKKDKKKVSKVSIEHCTKEQDKEKELADFE